MIAIKTAKIGWSRLAGSDAKTSTRENHDTVPVDVRLCNGHAMCEAFALPAAQMILPYRDGLRRNR